MISQYCKLCSSILISLMFSGFTQAAPDIEAGKEQAGMCFSCHGEEGNSQNSNFPSLAGQKPAYLVNQLRAFRSGARENGLMQNISSSLLDQDITNLAAYFGSIKNKSAGGDSALVKKGQSKVSMCFGCHGQGAKGMAVTPRLAGQQPAYLQKQLKAFKSETRKKWTYARYSKYVN